MTQTATLDQLKPGHEYPGANLNARTTDREQDIDALMASIKSEGILQSLLVTHHPKGNGALYVIAGNRRLAALRKMKWDKDVPVIVRDDVTPGSALAMSLAENVTQCPLHPVDRYEAFAALFREGKTEADIAASYSVSQRTVKQSLALGRLSPKVRNAWRKEEVDARTAQAFTLAKSEKEQDQVFDKLKKGRGLQQWTVRQELVGDQQDTKKFLTLVGREAYEAAGGKLQTDLFAHRGPTRPTEEEDFEEDDGELLVSDKPLLIRLAGEVIKQKCEALIAAGWAWAEDQDDLPDSAKWMWKKIAHSNANAPKEEKAKSGCAVSVDYNGKLEITYGLVKPGTKAPAAKTADGKSEKPKAATTLSNSLKHDLESMAAKAVQDALRSDIYKDALVGILARIVAAQIQTENRYSYTPQPILSKFAAIRDGINPKVMNEALLKRFNRERYFQGAPKNLVLKAIKEAVGEEHAKKLAGGTKAAAWKFALANVPKTWLPPELRAAAYGGPGAKSKTVSKKKVA